jgi:hypothetical protein
MFSLLLLSLGCSSLTIAGNGKAFVVVAEFEIRLPVTNAE